LQLRYVLAELLSKFLHTPGFNKHLPPFFFGTFWYEDLLQDVLMYSNIEFYDKSESALKQGRIFSFQTKIPNEKWQEVFLKPRYGRFRSWDTERKAINNKGFHKLTGFWLIILVA